MSVVSRCASIVLVGLVLGSTASAQAKKYEVKSGIVTYDVLMDIGKRKITNRIVVTFDDYGVKECRETYAEGRLRETFMSDGMTLWHVLHRNNEAFNRGPAGRGTEIRFAWEDVPDTDKRDGRARQIAPMTVAGRTCEAFTMVTANGMATFAGWKNIMLYRSVEGKDMKIVARAVKVEDDVAIPPSKFVVPANYQKKQTPF